MSEIACSRQLTLCKWTSPFPRCLISLERGILSAAVKVMCLRTFPLMLLLCPLVSAFAQEPYFPQGILGDDAQGDLFRSNWYSKHLKALEESSLFQMAKASSAESYRFVWLRTFHYPVIVRVDIKSDGSGELTTKVSSGAGGYAPGKLVENTLDH